MGGISSKASEIYVWCRSRFGSVYGYLAVVAITLLCNAQCVLATDPDPLTDGVVPTFGMANVPAVVAKVNTILAPVLVTLFLAAIGMGVIKLIWRMCVGFSHGRG